MFTPAEKVRRHIKCALWGEAKNGKTAFALSFPKPAVIDTEKGSVLFADRFKFDVLQHTRWSGLSKILAYLKSNPGLYETLVIDSITPLYNDLIDDVIEYVKNKRGNEILAQADWGTIKRRWKSFMTALLEIDMNVVLTMRSKDEYENLKNPKTGEDMSRKTGEHIADADKSTRYLFDFILECKVEENKKTKDVKYLVIGDGTRRPEIRRFQVFDVTGKNGYETVFKKTGIEAIVNSGKAQEQTGDAAMVEEIAPAPMIQPQPNPVMQPPAPVPERKTPAEAQAEILAFFTKDTKAAGELVTNEDLKVLFTRAGDVTWPDGSSLSSEDAKSMLKGLYKVESSKDLRKGECDQFYNILGSLLAGSHELVHADDGSVTYTVKMAGVRF